MDGFDENMKEKGADFRMEPGSEIWNRIEKQLDEKNQKRPVFWLWWLLPFILVAGFTYWAFFSEKGTAIPEKSLTTKLLPPLENRQEKTKKTTGQKNTVAKVTEKDPGQMPPAITEKTMTTNLLPHPENIQEKVKTVIGQNNTITEVPVKHPGQMPPAASEKEITMQSPFKEAATPVFVAPEKTKEFSESIITLITKQQEAEKPTQEDSVYTNHLSPNTDRLTGITQPLVGFLPPPAEIDLPLPTGVSNKILDSLHGGLTAAFSEHAVIKQKAQNKEDPNEKGSWRIIAGTGLHNQSSKGIGLNAGITAFNSGFLVNSPGNLDSTLSLQPTRAGMGFTVGLEKYGSFKRNKRFGWVAGFQYQYQSIRTYTGGLVDSSIQFENSRRGSNRTNGSASEYYLAGKNQSQTGSQHRIAIYTGLQLYLDKAKNWSWQNRIYGGILLSSDYLHPQTITPGWVASKNLVQKSFAGLETGFQYARGKWGTGIFAQYNLSASARYKGIPKQYWRGLELRFFYNIPSSVKK